MDANRAQQILKSPDHIPVEHQGDPVWIEQVDTVSESATVHKIENPMERKTVPVTELKEIWPNEEVDGTWEI